MKRILTPQKSHLLILVIFFQQVSCYAQEKSFLNRFHFPVIDTAIYKPHFYQEVFSYPDSTVTKLYTLDRSLVKEEVQLLDKEQTGIYKTYLEYDSLGNITGGGEQDRYANTEYYVSYYPDGQLKSRHQYVNDSPSMEEYFDENGDPINKPDEVYPSPKGGMKGWNRYLARNMVYPKLARRNREEGQVYIWFTVDSDGRLLDPEIMNPEQVSPLLAEEALRMILQYPERWSPGTKDGVAIPVGVRMPINFRIE